MRLRVLAVLQRTQLYFLIPTSDGLQTVTPAPGNLMLSSGLCRYPPTPVADIHTGDLECLPFPVGISSTFPDKSHSDNFAKQKFYSWSHLPQKSYLWKEKERPLAALPFLSQILFP